MTPIELTRSVRGLNRLRQIAQVLSRHGFGFVVAQLQLGRFVPLWMLRRKPTAADAEGGTASLGRRLADAFSELGPTFVKFGQILSTRADLVPADVLAELRKLQDHVPPFPAEEAVAIVEAELGQPIRRAFARFDAAPFASASISQVHRAALPNGDEVVVKIRRPGIDDVIRLDMHLLRWAAASLENLMPETRAFRPSLLAEELDETLTREMDFVNEASTIRRFAEGLGDELGVRVPRVHWDLSGTRVLTLEALPGRNVGKYTSVVPRTPTPSPVGGETPVVEPAYASSEPIDRAFVARRLADSFLKQVFEMGCFHGDPHPGNILVTPPAEVGLIDFGQVGTIGDDLQTELVTLLYACLNDQTRMIVDTLADMGAVGRTTDRRTLERSLEALLHKYHGLPMRRFVLGDLFTEFTAITRRHDVVLPRDLVLLIKATGTIAGVITSLDPELDLLALLQPRLEKALREQLSPRRIGRRTTLMGWDVFNIVRHAPRQLRELLRRTSTRGWELRVHHENLSGLARELDRAGNRLAFSVVIAGIIVGSSLVLSSTTTATLVGVRVQWIGIVGYLLAAFLGLGLSWAILRSGRLH